MNVRQVQFLPQQPKVVRVAAYARVSTGKDAMMNSLSAQVSYYNDYIQHHPGWTFCGVYSDAAKTGTTENRDGFRNLMDDCRAGKIDMVITKSISRFARNTVTLLQTVRDLKSLEVDVYFEEQNIHTISADGELMLTILASYAQEESLSASENMKWRIRKNFEEGLPWSSTMLGYRIYGGRYIVVPEEAALVKRIYADYLSGVGLVALANRLNAEGHTTRWGYPWHHNCVRKVLSNYTYTGNLLLQKTYREDHITKRKCLNRGELPMYLVEQAHEAIIPLEMYEAVQRRLDEQSQVYGSKAPPRHYPFSGRLICAVCGKKYRRKITRGEPFWVCTTYNSQGKQACPSKQIPECILKATSSEVLGLTAFDESIFLDKITGIEVRNSNTLVFKFSNGETSVKQWTDRSRADSWTPEMREVARQKRYEQEAYHGS